MLTRREFASGVILAASLPIPLAEAQIDPDIEVLSVLPPLPDDLAESAGLPPAPYLETRPVGRAPPLTDEVDTAWMLLREAPYDCAPIVVADYFLALGGGAFGREYQPYAREWPVRANPVIFHFFTGTQTTPQGDTTPWCAAFMNWCLLRGRATSADVIGRSPDFFTRSGQPFHPDDRRRYSTNSASSGSFRCREPTSSPIRGDIAVFADRGSENMTASCAGRGHVAFYMGNPREGVVRVVGGNQSEPGSSGAVTVADMSIRSGGRFFGYVKAGG